MKRLLLTVAFVPLFAIGLVGCSDTSTSTTERTISTPQGTTKVTTETKVEKKGENPP